MEVKFYMHLEKFQAIKTLNFHLELNFYKFSRVEKWKSFRLIATTFSLLELSLLDFVST